MTKRDARATAAFGPSGRAVALVPGALSVVLAASSSHTLSGLLDRLVGLPWGAVLLLGVTVYLLYLGARRFRRWALGGDAAAAPTVPTPEPTASTTAAPAWSEEEAPSAPAAAEPAATAADPALAALQALPASHYATVWRPSERPTRLEGYVPPQTISRRPPTTPSFGLRLLAFFVGIFVFLLIIHRAVFLAVDELVRGVGAVLYYPYPWPGLLNHPTLDKTLPDFILMTYVAVMIAFCLAAKVFSDPRFVERQRETAALVILAYLGAEALIDSVGFSFSARLVTSGFLLFRAILGGVFLTLLLFVVLQLPPPVTVVRKFARDRFLNVQFWVVSGVAVALGLMTLLVLYHWVGLGRAGVSFAVLLLLPSVSLTYWAAIGRALYAIEVRGRSLPTLGEYHPHVSVLIPAYNEEENITAAIASADAAAGLYPGVTEIVVGNDGSTDRTSALARAAISALAHARGAVVDLPHSGKSNALNGALSAATGEVVVRVDADSRISTTRGFGAMVSHLADPEVGGVQGLILPIPSTTWTSRLRFMEIAWNHLFLRRAQMATRTAQVVDGAFCAFRRSDLVSVGGWVPWNGEDTEITLRLQRQGYRMRFEGRAAAFEDVPPDYSSLRKQRIRWNRGGLFAHRRHLGALYGDAFEFGGLAMLMWLAFFVRGGVRGLLFLYAALVTLLVGLPTLFNVLLIAALLLVPRGVVIGYYMVRLGQWRYLPYLSIWPVTGSIKQFFSLEAFGTMLPGSAAEFAE